MAGKDVTLDGQRELVTVLARFGSIGSAQREGLARNPKCSVDFRCTFALCFIVVWLNFSFHVVVCLGKMKIICALRFAR